MTPAQKVKLKQVLENNRNWPLVIVGADVKRPDDAAVIPAAIPERDLHTDALVIKPYLLIDGLDTISEREQEKFITLLKDRRTGLRKLPEGVQTLIPVNSADKLSRKILDLALVLDLK